MLLLVALACLPDASASGEGPVDFNRDVLPILSEKCFTCHGPDGGTREADLRLDRRDELYKEVKQELWVVKPGDLARSELWYRVSTEDQYEVMPPFWSDGPAVTDAERAILARWIEGGAEWSRHWAFVRPVTPDVPDGANAIDHLAAAVRGGPAQPAAERAKLIRRVSLDLTGLPPSVEEVDAFLADEGPDAYERLVERLLDSPDYGEQRARRWLDLARYADTNGYEKDERRTTWRYRDWVIDAYARDLPFDQFTIEQLAGDLLPDPTTEQLVATGFHRNTMVNTEGGADPEEFRVAAVIDRVNTTASVWLGATLACAQCHSHKYDPYTQREYYGLFAYFNSTEDDGNATAPEVPAPTAAQREEEERLVAQHAEVMAKLHKPDVSWDAEQAAWEPRVLAQLGEPERWSPLWPSLGQYALEGGGHLTRLWDGSLLAVGARGPTDAYAIDTRLEAGGTVTVLRIDVLADEEYGPGGRADDGNFVLTDIEAEVVSTARSGSRRLRFAGATADFEQTDNSFPAQHAIDDDPTSGWAVAPQVRTSHWIELALEEPLELGPDDVLRVHVKHGYGASGWSFRRFRLSVTGDERAQARSLLPARSPWQVAGPFTGEGKELWSDALPPEEEHLAGAPHAAEYEGAGAWVQRPEWIDARVQGLTGENSAWILRRTLGVAEETEYDLKIGSDDSVRVYLNGTVVHDNEANRGAARGQDTVRVRLAPGDNRLLMKVVNYGGPAGFAFEAAPVVERLVPAAVEAALRTEASQRDLEQPNLLRSHFRREVSPRGQAVVTRLAELDRELDALRASIPTAMVMRERSTPRQSFILSKGSFLAPGDPVEPHTPEALHPSPPGDDGPAPNRLGLARWLVSPENPLTPRVVVNRAWEEVFGLGLVETSDDLGTRGDPPTNQALLDWLAVDFVESGWSTKALFRRLVTSDTYKQDSRSSADTIERDPRNVHLTRGPRYRLPAEAVRDNALAISGLLANDLGGPSVFPPQPEGIWAATYNSDDWKASTDSDRYRRGLYTFLRRTAPYPTYLMFDATSREVSCTRRSRTNTPLQALAALNDPAFVEAAGGLAVRMLEEGGTTDAERLTYGFRLCVARLPAADELAVLAELLEAERAHYAVNTVPASVLDRSARPFAPNAGQVPGADERAPWIVVANALLNLDETVTKN